MTTTDYLLLFACMGLVTYLPRCFPLLILTNKTVPQALKEWLDLIPVAILCALVCPEILTKNAPRELDFLQLKAFVALPTFLFAMKTKSLGGTVIFGMALYWIADKFF